MRALLMLVWVSIATMMMVAQSYGYPPPRTHVAAAVSLALGLGALGLTLHDGCCNPDAALREGDVAALLVNDAILIGLSALALFALLRVRRRRPPLPALLLAALVGLFPGASPRAQELQLVPVDEADYAALAKLTVDAWRHWSEADSAAILASADPSLLLLLERERDLAATLSPAQLLPPFASESRPCVPWGTTARVLALRQAYSASELAEVSGQGLLAMALAVPGEAARQAQNNLASFSKQGLPPAAFLRQAGVQFAASGDAAYLVKENWAWSTALRGSDGRWRFDFRMLLVAEEINLQIGWAYGLMHYAVGHGLRGKPAPADWPVEIYLDGVARLLPGTPSAEHMRTLIDRPIVGPAPACWRAAIEPPLLWCVDNGDGGGWMFCPSD